MNTGVQRSSLTPFGATTTTTPSGIGEAAVGKRGGKKNMFEIMIAHRIPYCATASVAYPQDFLDKIEKAKNTNGPSFVHVMAPCPTGWGFPSDETIEIGKMAVETGLWYLAEYEDGKVNVNMVPKTFRPVKDYLVRQKRFKHLTVEAVESIEQQRDADWNEIKKRWLI